MKQFPRFAGMDEWTPAQALAVYECCHLLSQTIWDRYESVLLEEMTKVDRVRQFDRFSTSHEDNLELPFDDDIPF